MVVSGQVEWRQSAGEVVLEVPLKGTSVRDVDVEATRVFVKVNFRPYLVLVDLFAEVNDESLMAVVKDGTLVLTFQKLQESMWPSLRCEDFNDKAKMLERRKAAMEEKGARMRSHDERLKQRKVEDSKMTTRAQMELDEEERQRLEELKDEEKREAERHIYETLDRFKKATPFEPEQVKLEEEGKEVIFEEAETEDAKEMAEEDCAVASDDLEKVLPPPREPLRLNINFTPRIFPTPMRESRKEEEEDWLLRNKRHLKGKAKKRLDGIDISERDPFWLKGKGDDFFRSGNIEAALNAYTCALEIDERMAASLSNRAACFLKLERFQRCIDDCTKALLILKEERESESEEAKRQGLEEAPKELRRAKEMRKKLHVRRGTAFKELKQFNEALKDFQLASELSPQNSAISKDCRKIHALVQSMTQKDLGDFAMKEKTFEKAFEHYNKAISFNPANVGALSNKAIAFVNLGNNESALQFSQQALEALRQEKGHHQTTEVKLLQRIGKLQAELGEQEKALQSFSSILEFEPENVKVAKMIVDLQKRNTV